MRKYYISNNNLKEGPFSLKELKDNNFSINPNTLIWHEDIGDWTEAKNIKELTPLILKTPPKLPFEKKKTKQKQELVRKFYNINIILVFVIASIISFATYSIYYISCEPNKYDNWKCPKERVEQVKRDRNKWVTPLGGILPGGLARGLNGSCFESCSCLYNVIEKRKKNLLKECMNTASIAFGLSFVFGLILQFFKDNIFTKK